MYKSLYDRVVYDRWLVGDGMQPATVTPRPFCTRFASAGTQLRTEQLESSLRDRETEGLVRYRQGRVSGWLLTAAGREVHDDAIATALRDMAWQQPALAGYGEFLDRNSELRQICTDWQLKDGTSPNDHSDTDYDPKVVDELTALPERAGSMLDQLGRGPARFAAYRPWLSDALARLRGGDVRALATPMSASYHCI